MFNSPPFSGRFPCLLTLWASVRCGEEWIDWRSNFEDDKEINEDDMTALQNSETAAGLENFWLFLLHISVIGRRELFQSLAQSEAFPSPNPSCAVLPDPNLGEKAAKMERRREKSG